MPSVCKTRARRVPLRLLPLLCLVLASGCQPPGARLIGRWQGTAVIVTLEFEARADGTATLAVRPPLGNAVVQSSGTWKAVKTEGDRLTFELTDDNGSTSTQTVTFRDNDHFVWTPPQQNVQIEFMRMVDTK